MITTVFYVSDSRYNYLSWLSVCIMKPTFNKMPKHKLRIIEFLKRRDFELIIGKLGGGSGFRNRRG